MRKEKTLVGKTKTKALKYVVIRTYSAGCFAGEIESRDGAEAVLRNARRLWYWDGAASLSQLAVSGTSKAANCKFSVSVPRHTVLGVIEVMEATPEARASIEAVPAWKA